MTSIGFVGLGNMGRPMTSHLADAGHDVTAFDLDDDAVERAVEGGATAATEVQDVARDAEIVFLSLPGPSAVEQVTDQLRPALSAGTVVVDLTTSTPATTDAVAARLAERDVSVLGAPVSGGKTGADEGTLAVMVGGDRAVYEACVPVLEAFAAETFHVGERPGHGHAVKLLNNYLSFTAMLATCEAVVLGDQAGLDRETLVDVFNASSGNNSATRRKIPDHVLTGRYDNGFALGLVEKDIRLFSEFGAAEGVPLMLGDLVRNLIGYAAASEGGDADETRIYDFVEAMMTGDGRST